MSKQPFFSIIIPTYNRPESLQIAISSVLNQTFQCFEIIIVDDNPNPDQSLFSIIQQYSLPSYDSRIRLIKNEKNLKASGARNAGAKQAYGQYLAFLDDDDYWDKEYLEKNYKAICEHKADFLASGLIGRKDGFNISTKIPPDIISPQDFYLRNPGIGGSNIVIRKELFLKTGGFDARLFVSEDKDFAIRLAAQDTIYLPIKIGLVYYTIHDNPHLSSIKSKSFLVGSLRFFNKYKRNMPNKFKKRYRSRIYFLFYLQKKKPVLLFRAIVLDWIGTLKRIAQLVRN